MQLRSITAVCCFLLFVASCSSGDEDAATTTGTSSTPARTTTTALAPTPRTATTAASTTSTTTVAATTTTSPIDALPAGLFCRDLAPRDIDYAGAVAYWLREGSPNRMDADRNGIPCETVYPAAAIAAYWDATTTAWGGPPWASLAAIAYADDVPQQLRARLQTNGFVIDPTRGAAHMAYVYEGLYPYAGRPVFVTTDAAFHTWHLLFDKLLRDTEAERLLPVLETFVIDLLAAARAQTGDLDGTPLEDAANRVEEHLEAVATVLELDVGAIGPRAAEEVALVAAHSARQASPTIGGMCSTSGCVDYTKMRPRGHYTRTAELTRFFKAMSMLGNTPYALDQTEPFRVGLLLSGLITADADLTAAWSTIYDVTAVIVGAADDYTPLEAAAAAGGLDDPLDLASDTAVRAIATELAATRPVEIDPEAASLRTMGVRFILDSYVLDQLAHPNVPSRGEVSALDVAAAFGSDFALDLQHDGDRSTDTAAYRSSMNDLRTLVNARTAADWAATVYDSWLHALIASFDPPAAGARPPFMRTEAWSAKAHQSGLGSYAELKHDTILYGKEGMAEGDMEPPPTVIHWVEPDPETFARIAATARLMRNTLRDFDMLPGTSEDWDSPRALLGDFIAMADRLATIAQSELQGDPPAQSDIEWLDGIGSRLMGFLDRTGYVGDDGQYGTDPYGALVADIFLNGFSAQVLEEGTGLFNRIHVIVPDGENGFQVATGGVYSYYEFWQPMEDRLTDEQWWARLEAGTLPNPPWWITEYLGS